MPISTAIGIVAAMVNRPQGLSRSAFVTTSASTASRMIMIAKMATIAAMPGDRVDFLLRHLAERLAVAPHRRAEDDEVLHRAAEHDAGDQPERAGQETELRGQRRADERARARRSPRSGGRRAPICWSARSRGRCSSRSAGVARLAIEPEDTPADEPRVEAIGDRVGAEPGDDDPCRADRLAARQRDDAERRRAGGGHGDPENDARHPFHGRFPT